jgi:3-oxoacyl-[acyl-carrier protein] reductase
MVLAGKRVVVTGAGSGIGRAVALGYAGAGAAVACLGRQLGKLEQTVAFIEGAGGRALALAADVADGAALDSAFQRAESAFGGINVVFGAAGDASENLLVEHADPQAFRHTLEVNLLGAFHTAQAAIPALRRAGGGHLIFVGSGMGHRAVATRAAYATSKAGLQMLVRVLAQELIDAHITVNELVPGPVLTEFIAGRAKQLRQGAGETEWFKQPEDVVPLALLLASHPLHGPTGQTFSLARREL